MIQFKQQITRRTRVYTKRVERELTKRCSYRREQGYKSAVNRGRLPVQLSGIAQETKGASGENSRVMTALSKWSAARIEGLIAKGRPNGARRIFILLELTKN